MERRPRIYITEGELLLLKKFTPKYVLDQIKIVVVNSQQQELIDRLNTRLRGE